MNKYMNNLECMFGLAADPGFVPGSAKSLELLDMTVVEIARTEIPVLILGESGTGKDVYARLLHRLSGGSEAQLRKLNCSILNRPNCWSKSKKARVRILNHIFPTHSCLMVSMSSIQLASAFCFRCCPTTRD